MTNAPRSGAVIDESRLIEIIAGFARRATGDFTLESLLRDLAVAVSEVLDVDGVGVSYHDGERMRTVHALPPSLERVERVQEEDQTGPCHDAVHTAGHVVEGQLAEHSYRWPRFAEEALAAGLHSVAALPLLGRDRAWGAMDLYRREPGSFSAPELAAAQVLADVACGYVVMANDRSVAERAQAQAAHAATHDVLTGLPNRALLYDRLHHAVANTVRGRTAVAVVFLDLDGFKSVNDAHGHHAGDELLRQVAQRLAAVVRQSDTLARWGGDEFVVVCEALTPNLQRQAGSASSASPAEGEVGATISESSAASPTGSVDEHALEIIIDRLHGVFDAPFDLPPSVRVRASIGVAADIPAGGPAVGRDEVGVLLRLADEAMYRAKRNHRSGRSSGQGVGGSANNPEPGSSDD